MIIAHPAVDLIVFPCSLRIRNFVIGIISVDKVLQDITALKDANRGPISELVSDSRDATVGVDF